MSDEKVYDPNSPRWNAGPSPQWAGGLIGGVAAGKSLGGLKEAMALKPVSFIDETRERHKRVQILIDAKLAEVARLTADRDAMAVAIAANEPPAPAESESGEQSDDVGEHDPATCALCNLTAFEDDHIVSSPLMDAQTCEEVDPRCSWTTDEPADIEEVMVDNWVTDEPLPDPLPAPAEEAEALDEPVLDAEPGPYDAAVEKGAITQDEADLLVSERDRMATAEQARQFAAGMAEDAERTEARPRTLMERFDAMLDAALERTRAKEDA